MKKVSKVNRFFPLLGGIVLVATCLCFSGRGLRAAPWTLVRSTLLLVVAERKPLGLLGIGGRAPLRDRLRENGRRTAAWLDRANTYDDLLTWHRHVVDPSIPPPAPRPPLPPELR